MQSLIMAATLAVLAASNSGTSQPTGRRLEAEKPMPLCAYAKELVRQYGLTPTGFGIDLPRVEEPEGIGDDLPTANAATALGAETDERYATGTLVLNLQDGPEVVSDGYRHSAMIHLPRGQLWVLRTGGLAGVREWYGPAPTGALLQLEGCGARPWRQAKR